MMKNNPITNQKFAALANGLPVPLTLTFSGTGAGTAWISGDNLIIDITTAIEVDKYANVSTPIAFDVLDVQLIHGDANDCAVQIKNGTSAITDAIAVAASDTDIDYAGTLDNTYQSFAAGDDDLRIYPTTDAFIGRIVIKIDK